MIATPVFPDLAALVADESLYMRRILRDMLTRVGIKRVFEAPDGAEALGVLSEFEARPRHHRLGPRDPLGRGVHPPHPHAEDLARPDGADHPDAVEAAALRRRSGGGARRQRDHRQAVLAEDPVVAPRRGAQPSARLRRGERALAPGAARGRGGREGGGLTRSFALWAWQRRRAVALFVPTRAPASCRAGASGFDRVGQGRSGCPAGFAGARRPDERAWRSALGAAGPAQRPAALAARASPPGRAAERPFLRGARSRHQQLPPARRGARPLRLSRHGRLLAHRAARRGLGIREPPGRGGDRADDRGAARLQEQDAAPQRDPGAPRRDRGVPACRQRRRVRRPRPGRARHGARGRRPAHRGLPRRHRLRGARRSARPFGRHLRHRRRLDRDRLARRQGVQARSPTRQSAFGPGTRCRSGW